MNPPQGPTRGVNISQGRASQSETLTAHAHISTSACPLQGYIFVEELVGDIVSTDRSNLSGLSRRHLVRNAQRRGEVLPKAADDQRRNEEPQSDS
jgi:hypothetical protein